MEWASDILGRGTVARLRAGVETPVIQIGRDVFTRGDLAAAQCFNYIAAHRLSVALASLNVVDTLDAFRHVEPEQLALPQLGPIALSVLGACFDVKHVGTLTQWVEKSRKKHERVTTFQTIKTRIATQTTKTVRKANPKRSSSRRLERARAADRARRVSPASNS